MNEVSFSLTRHGLFPFFGIFDRETTALAFRPYLLLNWAMGVWANTRPKEKFSASFYSFAYVGENLTRRIRESMLSYSLLKLDGLIKII